MSKKLYNHSVQSKTVNILANTGSRNRLRIPVVGTRFVGIQPGDRVSVKYSTSDYNVDIVLDPNGNYKVEKNGAIRFPAHKFNLPSKDAFIAADQLSKKVMSI